MSVASTYSNLRVSYCWKPMDGDSPVGFYAACGYKEHLICGGCVFTCCWNPRLMHRQAVQTLAPLHSSSLNVSHLSSFLILGSLIIQPNGVIKYMMLSKQWLGASVCCCWKHIIDEEVGCHYQHIGRIMYLLHQCYSNGREMDSTYLARRQGKRENQLPE